MRCSRKSIDSITQIGINQDVVLRCRARCYPAVDAHNESTWSLWVQDQQHNSAVQCQHPGQLCLHMWQHDGDFADMIDTQSESVLIQKIYTHFKKAPGTHKLGVLYVVDSVTRSWVEQARKAGQQPGPSAAYGTYGAGVYRVTELLPMLMTDITNSAPEDQKVRSISRISPSHVTSCIKNGQSHISVVSQVAVIACQSLRASLQRFRYRQLTYDYV